MQGCTLGQWGQISPIVSQLQCHSGVTAYSPLERMQVNNCNIFSCYMSHIPRLCSEENWRKPSASNLWNPGCPALLFLQKNYDFLVTQGQKLGARGQWALLEHGLVKIFAAVGRITRGSRQNFCGFYLISLITSKCWVEAKYSTGSSKIAGCWLIFTGLQLYSAWVFLTQSLLSMKTRWHDPY